jgi:hypothetical protein
LSQDAEPPPIDSVDPALALLRDLGDKATLSADSKRRIAAELARRARPARSYVLLSCAGAACAIAAALWLVHWRTAPPPIASRQKLVVPPCGISRLFDETERYRAVFVGPSEATIENGGRVSITAGRAMVATAERGVALLAPGVRIFVAPRSFVEVVVREYRGARIDVYEGAAKLEIAQQVTWLRAGDAWDEGVAHVAPGAASTARHASEADTTSWPGCRAEGVSPPAIASAPPRIDAPPALAIARHHALPSRVERRDEAHILEPPSAALPSAELPAAEPAPATALLSKAIEQLRAAHDPRAALATLDDHERQHPRDGFAHEIALIRVEAWLALGDRTSALGVLDSLALPDGARGDELLATRADLRARAGRCADAVADYGRVLANTSGVRAEVALMGRASCLFALGQELRGREDLEHYLSTFPNGQFAAQARRALGH